MKLADQDGAEGVVVVGSGHGLALIWCSFQPLKVDQIQILPCSNSAWQLPNLLKCPPEIQTVNP